MACTASADEAVAALPQKDAVGIARPSMVQKETVGAGGSLGCG